MAEVEWIKISTGMFEVSRKIKQIELMKDGDRILIIWFKLLILAGRVNDGGAIYITEDRPYDVESLAGELRRPIPLVKRALEVFQDYKMIEIEDKFIYLSNWEKYQSADKLEIIREQTRMRVKKCRQKKNATVTQGNATSNATVTQGNAIEEEEEGDTENSFIHSIARANDDEEKYLQKKVAESGLEGDDAEEYKNSVKENLKMKVLHGTLGGGVVMISNEQMDSLLEEISLDEFEKYISIVRDCEKNGQHYRKKTHYQAILDMVKKDRKS
ncbi:MAG: phage replisome organizer N-terminal domain-containing protein [Clostridia bacterium]|nr:phage replisome organizer N-terminal domain-containing protein [Clostridia bacterium]